MYMTQESASAYLFERKLDEWEANAKSVISGMFRDAMDRLFPTNQVHVDDQQKMPNLLGQIGGNLFENHAFCNCDLCLQRQLGLAHMPYHTGLQSAQSSQLYALASAIDGVRW